MPRFVPDPTMSSPPASERAPLSTRFRGNDLKAAHILVVDDDPVIRRIIRDRFASDGHKVSQAENGREALEFLASEDVDLMLLDLRMPILDGFGVLSGLEALESRPEVIVITAHGSIESAIKAVQMGATDFISKPFESAHISHVVGRALRERELSQRIVGLTTELSTRHTLVPGKSPRMQEVLHTANRVAGSQSTVLLLGESGTGKEVLARYVHSKSERANGPFLALNCATLSSELLASELFGHERGAFTGAVKTKAGKLEEASGGTLFLDEVGELPLEVQAKLLRVLQEREFERVGGTRTLRADVRIVAATHRDLSVQIKNGEFREDLYYRLAVISLKVPALRERRSDISDLLRHFIGKQAQEAKKPGLKLSRAAEEKLMAYDWPGNVRELANVIERGAVLCSGDLIELGDLPDEVREARLSEGDEVDLEATSAIRGESTDLDLASIGDGLGFHDQVLLAKRAIIARALAQTGGHQTRAAENLGLTQPYLARLMKNLGVSRQKK